MTHEAAASFAISAVAAVASVSIADAGGGDVNTLSFFVPILSAVIGGAMGWGVLQTSVSNLNREMKQMRQDMGHVYELLRSISDRVAKIEGKLDS